MNEIKCPRCGHSENMNIIILRQGYCKKCGFDWARDKMIIYTGRHAGRTQARKELEKWRMMWRKKK